MKRRTKIAIGSAVAVAIAIGVGLVVRKEEHTVYLPMIMSNTKTIQYSPIGYGGSNVPLEKTHYHWNVGPIDADTNQARMIWCLSDEWMTEWQSQQILQAAMADYSNSIRGRVWLILNEPAHPFGGQCNEQHIDGTQVYLSPRKVAWAYKGIYETIKGIDLHARIFVGGIVHIGVPETGQWWWTEFVDELDDNGWLDTIEGVHVHVYPKWSVYCADPFGGNWPQGGDWCMSGALEAADDWYRDFHIGLGLGNCPIWITEAGCAPYVWDLGNYGDDAQIYCRDSVMGRYQDWFPQSDYDAILWFTSRTWTGGGEHWWPTALVVDGELTPLGEQWTY